MKTKSLLHSFLFVTSAVLFLTSCSGDKKQDAAGNKEDHGVQENSGAAETDGLQANAPQFEVDATFRKQLEGVFINYVRLKDALVSSDAKKTGEKAAETSQALADVDMTLLSGAAHNDWMNYRNAMAQSLNAIKSETDIEGQRKAFSTLSDNLYRSIKAFGLAGSTAYYEFCPMAFNDEGAYWLSDASQIRNPYFGDKMLGCGEVKEKLR